MGVWDNILDLNGIDKLQKESPKEPGLFGDSNRVAQGMIPLCGMNVAFRAELTPAFFFLPDIWIDGWQLSRHDDIWGGYILERLMAKRGDLLRFGRPVVEHTKQTNLNRVIMLEHYMHLMAMYFYDLVDAAVDAVRPADYRDMFAAFAAEYRSRAAAGRHPAHYRRAFVELGETIQRWSDAFVDPA